MSTKPKSTRVMARERVRAARAAQLAETQRREQKIEEAATSFYMTADRIADLDAERERVLEQFAARQAALELEQGRSIVELRTLENVGVIAELLEVSPGEVTRLSKLATDMSDGPASPDRSGDAGEYGDAAA
ncbi:hypothetical protein ACIPY5_19800 [Microbacterium sp. NPDC089698]|uniref:hypothetical protein n=1 Tax=Microbacterium sp. NPDC089698 TaxID=3364200 RepID=UPI0038181183